MSALAHGQARKIADQAGGDQLNTGQDFVRLEDGNGQMQEAILLGDPVQGHGTNEHQSPVMAQGSSFKRIENKAGQMIPQCREGHLASCSHPSTGSPQFFLED